MTGGGVQGRAPLPKTPLVGLVLGGFIAGGGPQKAPSPTYVEVDLGVLVGPHGPHQLHVGLRAEGVSGVCGDPPRHQDPPPGTRTPS